MTDIQDTGASGASVYSAFISYSHQDEERAAWLQRRLEAYRTPGSLVGRTGAHGPIPRRLKRVFRDAQELQVGNLNEEIRKALASADALIVLCSPAAAQSPWVNREVGEFKGLGKGGRILPAIIGGEPHAEGKPGFTAADECFPADLLYKVAADGTPTGSLDEELIASDFRKGKDGDETGFLRIVAGLLGVGLDDLIQREKQAELRRRMFRDAIIAVMAVLTIGAVAEWRDAVRQSQRAHKALVQLLPDLGRDIFDRELALNSVRKTGLARAARFTLAGLALSPARPEPFRELLGRLAMASRSTGQRPMRVSCLGGGRVGPPDGGRPADETPILALGNALDATGSRLVFACPDASVHIWDFDRGSEFASTRTGGKVLAAAFAANGRTVEIAAPDGSVRMWDPARGLPEPGASAATSPVIAAAMDPGEGISQLADGAPAPLTPAIVERLSKLSSEWKAVAMSADGRLEAIAEGASPAFVRIEAPGESGSSLALRDVLSQRVTGLAFSPDSSRLVTTDLEGRVRVWNVTHGTSLLQIPAGGQVGAPSFSGDGNRIVVSREGQARVWDIQPLSESLPNLVRQTCKTLLAKPAAHRFTDAEMRAEPLILELWSEEHFAKDTDLCLAAQAVADRTPVRKTITRPVMAATRSVSTPVAADMAPFAGVQAARRRPVRDAS